MDSKSLQSRFSACYECEADALFRFCLVRVSDRELALDITQETFTRLWQSLAEGSDIHNDRAFLFTIAHHVVIDWYRKKKAVSLEALEESFDSGSNSGSVSGAGYQPTDNKVFNDLEEEAEGRYLLEKLEGISVSNRHAVYLRFIEGMAPPQIGEILNISANAASVRVNRGLRELRRLTGYDSESLAGVEKFDGNNSDERNES